MLKLSSSVWNPAAPPMPFGVTPAGTLARRPWLFGTSVRPSAAGAAGASASGSDGAVIEGSVLTVPPPMQHPDAAAPRARRQAERTTRDERRPMGDMNNLISGATGARRPSPGKRPLSATSHAARRDAGSTRRGFALGKEA